MINPEILFERYREGSGVPFSRFLKMCRDCLLLDNSFTYSDATFTFYSLCDSDEDEGLDSEKPILSSEGFNTAIKRIARQSSAIDPGAKSNATHPNFQEATRRASIGGSAAAWNNLRRHIAENLCAAPRSDDDVLLNTFILSEPVQTICFRYDLKLQKVTATTRLRGAASPNPSEAAGA